jgi:large subunit ribosomal protein L3
MKFIVGTKDGMTQVFDENGLAHPATVLRVPKSVVTALKTTEVDGYAAVQIATGEQKEHRVTKAELGHLGSAYKFVQEFRPRKNFEESLEGIEKGAELDASVFDAGDMVIVSAVSKGKGFQGVVKRYNFKGDKASHGRKHSSRKAGSIGATGPGRVFKGKKMAGRMGTDRTTVKNLKVLQVNADENLLLIKGAIPGRKGTLVEVRSA